MMAKIYVRKILANEMDLDDVPSRWKAEVEEKLKEEGDR